MNRSALKLISNYSDALIKKYTGIKNWSRVSDSLRKILDRHTIIANDADSLFFIDKLEITFKLNIDRNSFSAFRFDESETHFKFHESDLELIKMNKNKTNYKYLFNVGFGCEKYAQMFYGKISNSNLVKVEIFNPVLYSKTATEIIYFLITLADTFGFSFCNYSDYHVANDSQRNFYEEVSWIYYQSDFCNGHVPEIYKQKPKYTFCGKRRDFHNQVDKENNRHGTFTSGKKGGTTYAKVYTKTPDIDKKGKSYIRKIHSNFFRNTSSVYRIEGACNSSFFKGVNRFSKLEYDLIDLLNWQNLKKNFVIIIGDKLKFRSIEHVSFDEYRNEKYEVLDFNLDHSDVENFGFKVMVQLPVKPISTSKLNLKHMIYAYFDGRISKRTLIEYVVGEEKNDPFVINEIVNSAIDVARRNYSEVVEKRKDRLVLKLSEIYSSVKSNSFRRFQLIKLWLF